MSSRKSDGGDKEQKSPGHVLVFEEYVNMGADELYSLLQDFFEELELRQEAYDNLEFSYFEQEELDYGNHQV